MVQITEQLSRQKYSEQCQTFKTQRFEKKKEKEKEKEKERKTRNQGTSINFSSKTQKKRPCRETFWSFLS